MVVPCPVSPVSGDVASRPLGQVGPFARPLIRQLKNMEFEIKEICGVKTTLIQKKIKKNLNPCHRMLFLGSKYAKIAFAAWGA